MAGKAPVSSSPVVSSATSPVENGCVDITVDAVEAGDESGEAK